MNDSSDRFGRLVDGGLSVARWARSRLRPESPPEVTASGGITKTTGEQALENATEPPVVARLMVEIRSDGSRTIARGAMEDIHSGQRVAIEALGTTPAQLAASLAKSLLTLPAFASRVARSLSLQRTSTEARPGTTNPEVPEQIPARAKQRPTDPGASGSS